MLKMLSLIFGCVAAVSLCGCGEAEEETYVPETVQEPMSSDAEAPVGGPDEVTND